VAGRKDWHQRPPFPRRPQLESEGTSGARLHYRLPDQPGENQVELESAAVKVEARRARQFIPANLTLRSQSRDSGTAALVQHWIDLSDVERHHQSEE
jgi:hypothetical protein